MWGQAKNILFWTFLLRTANHVFVGVILVCAKCISHSAIHANINSKVKSVSEKKNLIKNTLNHKIDINCMCELQKGNTFSFSSTSDAHNFPVFRSKCTANGNEKIAENRFRSFAGFYVNHLSFFADFTSMTSKENWYQASGSYVCNFDYGLHCGHQWANGWSREFTQCQFGWPKVKIRNIIH